MQTIMEEITFKPSVKGEDQSGRKEANESLKENYQKTSSSDTKRKEHKTKMLSNKNKKHRYKQKKLTGYVKIITEKSNQIGFLRPDTHTKGKEHKKNLRQTLSFTLEIPNMKPNIQSEEAKSVEKQKGYKDTNSSQGNAFKNGTVEGGSNKNIRSENEKEGGLDKQSTIEKPDRSNLQCSHSIMFIEVTRNITDSNKQMPQKNSMAEASQNYMREYTTETADDCLPPKLDLTTETVEISEEDDDIIAQTEERIKAVEELISKARISLIMDSEKISRDLEKLQNDTKAIKGNIILMNRTLIKQASQLSRTVIKWTCAELANRQELERLI